MKFKKSLLTLLTITSGVLPIVLAVGCNKSVDPIIVKDIFQVEKGELLGLKQGVTKDDIKTNIKNNTLVLPAVKTIKENAFVDGSLINLLPNNTKVVVNAEVIEPYAFYGSDKTTIEIELQNTTTIEKSAFAQMLGLTSVTFPNTLKSIGASAFLGDSALEDISIVAFTSESAISTISFGNISVFSGSKTTGRIRGTTVETTSAAWTLFSQNGLSSQWDIADKDGVPFPIGPMRPTPPEVFTFSTTSTEAKITGLNPAYAEKFDSYSIIQIPDAYDGRPVTSIADGVFCDNPESISVKPKFPNTRYVRLGLNLQNIGKYNFALLTSLAAVLDEAPNLATIDDGAFQGCARLSSFPHFGKDDNKIGKIGKKAFYGCQSLSIPIKLGSETYKIDTQAFSTAPITSLTITSDKISEIYESAFASCKKLTEVDLSKSSIKKVYKQAFELCDQLKVVKFSDQIEYIQEKAFQNDDKLEGVSSSNNTFYYTSTGEDVLKWTKPSQIAGILKTGEKLYKCMAYFEHHELLFDNSKLNKIKLKLHLEYPQSITWDKQLASGVSFDESTYELNAPQGTTSPCELTMTVTLTDPFVSSQTYTVKDKIKITYIDDQTQTGSADVSQYINDSSLSDECAVNCLKPSVEGIEANNWTYKIPDVYNSRYVTKIADYGFGQGGLKFHASKFAHFSLPAVLKTVGQGAFDHSGDDMDQETLKQRVGDSSRLSFRGENYTGLTINANSICNFKIGSKFTIPLGMPALQTNALQNLEWLEEITIPSTLYTLNANAITQCNSMKYLNLPEGSKWMTLDEQQSFTASDSETNWTTFKQYIDKGWKRVF